MLALQSDICVKHSLLHIDNRHQLHRIDLILFLLCCDFEILEVFIAKLQFIMLSAL